MNTAEPTARSLLWVASQSATATALAGVALPGLLVVGVSAGAFAPGTDGPLLLVIFLLMGMLAVCVAPRAWYGGAVIAGVLIGLTVPMVIIGSRLGFSGIAATVSGLHDYWWRGGRRGGADSTQWSS